jgi:hypothetical protein
MTARDSLVSRDARTALQTFIAILAPPKHGRELSDFLRNTQYNIMLMQNAKLSTWREHAFKRFQVCGFQVCASRTHAFMMVQLHGMQPDGFLLMA